MIDRRHFSILAGAAFIAPRAFASEPARRLPPHDKKAAKAEFTRIVAMFQRGDTEAFVAYGPPEILAYDTPEVGGRKPKLGREQIPDFIAERMSQGGQRDQVPIRIDSFARMKNVIETVVYSATLKRSAFSQGFCEVDGECTEDGYVPMYEFYRVYFSGPRIRLLEQHLILS
jgi:hypothetical protein